MAWVLVHGFGVRGAFWDKTSRALGGTVWAPSWDHKDLDGAVATLQRDFSRFAIEAREPVWIAGHSLGGVLSLLAAASLGRDVVAGLVVVSSPWAAAPERRGDRFVRFLLSRGWLPGFLVRPRFFGSHVPVQNQKALFRTAVPESPTLRALVGARPWFHPPLIPAPYPHPLLVVGSDADRIVSGADSTACAQALGGRLVLWPASRGWGHDDPAVDPVAADELARLLNGFGHGLSPKATTTETP